MLFLVVINTIVMALVLGRGRLGDGAMRALFAVWVIAAAPVLLPELGEPIRSIAGWTGQGLLSFCLVLAFFFSGRLPIKASPALKAA